MNTFSGPVQLQKIAEICIPVFDACYSCYFFDLFYDCVLKKGMLQILSLLS